jgi:NitT/TauT family transport system substrate-binding protein/taurine transport system substrate-binding protein
MMRSIQSKIQFGALGLLLVVGLAACGSVSASSKSSSPVTIGYENAPDPEAVAIEQHFFQKDLGAPVKLIYFSSGPTALDDLASGKLDFMTTLGNPPTASAIARGVPLKVIWAMERYTTAEGLVVRKTSHITSLKDLEGKTVDLVEGSTSPFELDTTLKLAGIPVSKVKEENMSPPDMVAAWKTKQIDAAYTWVPFVSAMKAAGGQMLMYDQDVYQEAPIFNLAVVNASWAKSHGKWVRDFVRAEQAGVTFYQQHPAKAYQDMGKLNNISAAEAEAQAKGLSFTTIQQQLSARRLGTTSTVRSSLVTKSLTSAAQWLYQTGQISTLPKNMAQYVDPQYVQEVLH